MKKKILIGLAIVLTGIQFIQPRKNLGNAAGANDVTHYVQVPKNVMEILQMSCYDCHSNHTNYPWYSYVNPIGLWLNHHITDGKSELNFSDFSQYDGKKLDRKLKKIAQEVEEHEMPIGSYTLIHREASLNEAETKTLIDWAQLERSKLTGESLR